MDWTSIIVAALGVVQAVTIALIVAVFRTTKEVKLDVNSRMTELLDLTRESSHALGVDDERRREKGQDE